MCSAMKAFVWGTMLTLYMKLSQPILPSNLIKLSFLIVPLNHRTHNLHVIEYSLIWCKPWSWGELIGQQHFCQPIKSLAETLLTNEEHLLVFDQSWQLSLLLPIALSNQPLKSDRPLRRAIKTKKWKFCWLAFTPSLQANVLFGRFGPELIFTK